MKRFLLTAFIVFSALFPQAALLAQHEPAPDTAPPEDDYIIGPGDILFVVCLERPGHDPNRTCAAGRQDLFPLIGEIQPADDRSPKSRRRWKAKSPVMCLTPS